MWQKILQFDRALFEKINSDWANPLFDVVMPFVRHQLHWAPLYLFLLVFLIINYKHNWLWWVVFFLATVALTDMTGTYIFKHNFQRLRPCNDPEMIDRVRHLLDRCGGYSFISNHAANHFGMGAFFYFTFRHHMKKWAWVGLAWAALIAYAQVYVGIHYPADVLAGALLGLVFGTMNAGLFNKRYGFAIFEQQRYG